MKKLTLILVAAIAAASLSSCGTAGHLASGYDTEEMRNVMLFEPVSKIETIGKGNISVTNDTACLASQELLLQTLMTYDTGMNISSTYTSGEDEEIRKGIEYLYAQYLNTGYGHDNPVSDTVFRVEPVTACMSFVVPESLDSIIEKSGNRYGMAVYSYGFSRTGGNYAAEIAKGVGLAILTLGTVYTVPYKDKSYIHVFIIDSEQNRIAWHNNIIGADYNPLKPKHIEKQIKRLFKPFKN